MFAYSFEPACACWQYFKVPVDLQRTVLSWGIAGAVVMRGIFITAGLVAIQTLRPVLVLFASFLIFSSYKILSGGGDDDEDDEDLSNNAVVKFSSSLLKSTDAYDGDKFFTMVCLVAHSTRPLFLLSHPVGSAPVSVTRVFACAHVQEHMHCIFAHVHTHSHG